MRLIVLMLVVATACSGDIGNGIETANQLYFEQKYARAEALYRRTLKRLDEKDGGRAKPSKELMIVLDRLGKINALYLHNYDQSVNDYARLVAEYPESEDAFNAQVTIADIYENRLGNLAQAAAEYQRLLKKFPNHPDAPKYAMQLSESFFRLKNYEQADLSAQDLVAKWPSAPEVPKARFNIAQIAYVSGKVPAALVEYEKLVAEYPNEKLTPLIQFEMASCYQELGQNDKALEALLLSLKTHPHPQVVQRKIARIQHRQTVGAPSKGILESQVSVGRGASSRPTRKAALVGEGEAPAPEPEPDAVQD